MAKKKTDLNALAKATISKTPSVDAIFDAPISTAKEAPAQTSTGAKRGRPAATTAPDEVNVTFRLSAALLQELKIKAVMEHTTQKEIVDAALRQYLNN